MNNTIRRYGHILAMNKENVTEYVLNMKIKGKDPKQIQDKDRNSRLAKMSRRRNEEHGRKLRKTETEGDVLVAR
jgi:hypothetical protein